MRNRFILFCLTVLFFLLTSSVQLFGQYQGSLLMLRDNFHARMMNPSFLRDDEAIEIAVPVLGGFSFFHAANFKISDLITTRETGIPVLDFENFYQSGNTKNLTGETLYLPVFFFSKPLNRGRISFYMNEKMHAYSGFKMNAVEFALNGNIEPEYRKFSSDKIHVFGIGYRELAAGYAWRKNRKLTLGGHVKFLLGSAFIELNDWEYGVETAPEADQVILSSAGNGNMSIPVPIELSDNHRIIRVDGEGVVGRYFRSYRNPGLALDLGATFKIDKTKTFSAAVNDLGGILFHHNTVNLQQNEILTFRGFDLTNAVRYPESGTVNPAQLFLDTKEQIRDVYRPVADTAIRFKGLSPKIILNYTNRFTDWLSVGITNQTEFRRNFFLNLITVSAMQHGANISFFENLNFHSTGSLSIGGGFQYEARYFQVFLAAGNVMAFYHPAANKTFSLEGGLCFLLNHEKNQKPSSLKNKRGPDSKGEIYPWRPFYRVKK